MLERPTQSPNVHRFSPFHLTESELFCKDSLAKIPVSRYVKLLDTHPYVLFRVGLSPRIPIKCVCINAFL